MRAWLEARVLDPLRHQLRQGLTPGALAWSLALGLALGIIPLWGTSTLLCLGLAALLRLNQPAMQVANYLAYPLQILLLLPFIRMGESLFGGGREGLTLPALHAALQTDAWGTLLGLWSTLWFATLAWLLVAPLPTAILAWILRPMIHRAQEAIRRGRPEDTLS